MEFFEMSGNAFDKYHQHRRKSKRLVTEQFRSNLRPL